MSLSDAGLLLLYFWSFCLFFLPLLPSSQARDFLRVMVRACECVFAAAFCAHACVCASVMIPFFILMQTLLQLLIHVHVSS